MDRKIFYFFLLSILIILAGMPIALKQDWSRIFENNSSHQVLADQLKNVHLFHEEDDILLQGYVGDSARILFRFPPHTCSCLEPDFAEGINNLMKEIDSERIFVVIATDDVKEVFFFRERTRLTCPVYATTDTLSAIYDMQRAPYACVIYPDLTAQKIIKIHPAAIKELTAYVKENIR